MSTERADPRPGGAVDQALVDAALGQLLVDGLRAGGVLLALVRVLDDLGRHVRVLRGAALGRRRDGRDGHGGAGTVVDEVWGGWDA